MDGRGWGLQRLMCLHLLQGRFGEAKTQAQRVIEMGERLGQRRWVTLFRNALSYLEHRSGHPEAALQELDKAWAIATADDIFADQRDILLNQGLAHLELNNMAKAQDVAVKLKAAVDVAPNKKLVWYSHYLTGMIELQKKNYSKALGFFNQGLPLLNADAPARLLFGDAMGGAFYQLGNLNSARLEYEKIVSLTFGRRDCGDVYAKSFYWLGKISEQQGNKAVAAEHYRKFLDLWKNADPGRPEVEDARKRLAAI